METIIETNNINWNKPLLNLTALLSLIKGEIDVNKRTNNPYLNHDLNKGSGDAKKIDTAPPSSRNIQMISRRFERLIIHMHTTIIKRRYRAEKDGRKPISGDRVRQPNINASKLCLISNRVISSNNSFFMLFINYVYILENLK